MRRLLVLAVLFLFSACAPSQTPEQTGLLRELAARPVVCAGRDDCRAKWSRALEWVDAHSQEGLRTVSDNLIATNVFTGEGPDALHAPEFTVVRFAVGPDAYRMDFSSYCDRGFECGVNTLRYRAGFVTFVMGPPPGVRVRADGNGASADRPAR